MAHGATAVLRRASFSLREDQLPQYTDYLGSYLDIRHNELQRSEEFKQVKAAFDQLQTCYCSLPPAERVNQQEKDTLIVAWHDYCAAMQVFVRYLRQSIREEGVALT